MSGGYKALFEGGGVTGAGGTLLGLARSFFLPGLFFVLAGSKGRLLGQGVTGLLILAYASVYLALGYRAYALFPLIAYAWVWHRCIRPLPLVPLAGIAGALLMVVAPLVRQVRNLGGSDRFSMTTLVEAYTSIENPVLALLNEMGGTVFTVAYTLELVPAARPFEWGMGYVRAFLNAIPILDLPTDYPVAGEWLAWAVKPEWAANGFGFGYSFIAEAFLNGGWFGAPLVLLGLGAAIVGVARWAERSGDAARIACVASFLPAFLFFARGEALSLARPILWYALLPYLAVLLLRRLAERARRTWPAVPDLPTNAQHHA